MGCELSTAPLTTQKGWVWAALEMEGGSISTAPQTLRLDCNGLGWPRWVSAQGVRNSVVSIEPHLLKSSHQMSGMNPQVCYISMYIYIDMYRYTTIQTIYTLYNQTCSCAYISIDSFLQRERERERDPMSSEPWLAAQVWSS